MADAPRTYPAGVPCWVDLGVADLDAAQTFYGGLFGWSFERVTPPEAPPYVIAQLDGRDAAGLGEGDHGWVTYLAVDDADAAAAAVEAAGGTVTSPPLDAGPGGRDVGCEDPTGVTFHLWQARRRLGAQAVNQPNAWGFSNLRAAHPALEFYEAAFGWRSGDSGGLGTVSIPGYGEHLRTTVDPGIRERQQNAPEGFADVVAGVVPPDAFGDRFDVSFTVADRDASAQRAGELGGQVLERADQQWTRTATVRGPGGELFSLSQFAPPDDF